MRKRDGKRERNREGLAVAIINFNQALNLPELIISARSRDLRLCYKATYANDSINLPH
jgi:hypothetical protein